MKPVFIINGFLESGKSEFITYTLNQPYFQIKGKTLIVLCEEGEVEYTPELLKRSNSVIELIEEEEDFTPAKLLELEKKHKPERVIIEYNGMWNFKNMKMPWHWKTEQQITTIDGSTFSMYYTNMRSLLAEMIRNSEMIIFNRCDGIEDLNSYKRNVKAINQQADIIFEDSNGEIDEIFEDDLPFDLNADPIELDDMGYGIWYIDSLDHLERYVGKKIRFVAQVMKPDGYPKDHFIPGRMAMTCCADDMAFLGHVCVFKGAEMLKEQEWIQITATIGKGYWADYGGEGLILTAESVVRTKAPREKVISFV